MPERILTINIRKEVLKTPRWKKAKRATVVLREILERKTKKKVRIERSLNEKIWRRGIKTPPARIKIKLTEIDDKTLKAEAF